MARQEFLGNLRIARNLFVHPRLETDGRHLDPQEAEQQLARAAIWLTPGSVRGFDPADFPELGLDRQRELQAAVRDFLEIANQVPPTKPPTPEQYGKAAAFGKLLEILGPYLPVPEEGRRVEKALRSIEFPPWVINWDYELGSDYEGAPALWVNLFVDGSAASPDDFGRLTYRLTQRLLPALAAVGVSRWPYIQVRTAAEHKAR